jgi:LysR family transcriptional activator of nhaA
MDHPQSSHEAFITLLLRHEPMVRAAIRAVVLRAEDVDEVMQAVSLVAAKEKRKKVFRFPEDLDGKPVLVPSMESSIRTAFDLVMDRHGVRPVIAAEVDDMAMLRLLARESGTMALVPRVVVLDELDSGVLVERHRFQEIREGYRAVRTRPARPCGLVRR